MSNIQRTIFISYRQADNADFVARIRDWLINKYGRDHVFMDFDSIPPFVKFKDFIKGRIEKSDIVLIIIGERWLELMNEKIQNDDEDYVLVELQTALTLNKTVAPILIKSASMPQRRELPESVRELAEFNAARLDSGTRFYDEIQSLMDSLEAALGRSTTPPPPSHPANTPKDPPLATKEAYVTRGNEKHNRGDHDGAIADYTEAIRLDPNYAVPYNNRGISRHNKGDHDGAIADYTQAIRLDPNYVYAYVGRGNARQAKGDHDSAIGDYTQAIRLDPNDALAYISRGFSRQAKGDLDGAIADYTQAIRLDPNDTLAYKNRGISYQTQNNYSQAIADYQRYLDLGGGKKHGDQFVIESIIRDLKQQLGQK